MDYSKMIGDSFAYAKDGLLGSLGTWLMLIILAVLPAVPFILGIVAFIPSIMVGSVPDMPTLFGVLVVAFIAAILLAAFYSGYQVRILRGVTPLPPVSEYGRLFSDGIRYIVIEIVYSIPVLIIIGVTLGAAIMSVMATGMTDINAVLPVIGGVIAGVLLALVVAFIIGLFATIGVVRFARTGSVGEAFNFGAIIGTIRKMGWGSYILALIIVIVIVVIVEIVIGIIPYIGSIIQIIVSPWITVFLMRYISLLYDSAEGAAVQETPAP